MISFQTGFINPQLETGPVATAYFQAIQAEMGFAPSGQNPSSFYLTFQYLYDLSIDTANSYGDMGTGELDSIGRLIGYPWPSVYGADFSSNFQFITASSFPGTNPYIGFSDAASGITYGTFTSALPEQAGVYASVTVYRQILKFVAMIKWNGLTIPSIDSLINNILTYLGYPTNGTYTIRYDSKSDILVNLDLTTANIGVGWLYVLQLLFNKVCTAPQVLLSIS